VANEIYNPQVNVGAINGQLSSQSLAASTTVTSNLDLTGAGTSGTGTNAGYFGVDVQVKNTGGGTVAGTNGCQVSVYRTFGATPAIDTIPIFQVIIPTVTSTASYSSFHLETGRYQIALTNLDATNAITVGISTTIEQGIISNP